MAAVGACQIAHGWVIERLFTPANGTIYVRECPPPLIIPAHEGMTVTAPQPAPRAGMRAWHFPFRTTIMNISKAEQRVLHALAQGGAIRHRRDDGGRAIEARCFTREGYALTDSTLAVFHRLKRRSFIASHGGTPYRITRAGLLAVRAQLDNR
jgi:hypothetical protein